MCRSRRSSCACVCSLSFCRDYIIFFFNDTATTEIYTLSLHDALPIYRLDCHTFAQTCRANNSVRGKSRTSQLDAENPRSEEHTSELQSQSNIVCRLLLEKKKQITVQTPTDRAPGHVKSCVVQID